MDTQNRLEIALQEIKPFLKNIRFPINIIYICENLGIKVKETKDFPQNISGLIYKDKDNYTILVNSLQSAGRKSFTIAHELGHYFMHRERLNKDNEIISGAKGVDFDSLACLTRQDITTDSTLEYRQMETEANKFAAEILMPAEVFIDKCIELDSIDDVARFFGVSISAATIRADRLGGLYFL